MKTVYDWNRRIKSISGQELKKLTVAVQDQDFERAKNQILVNLAVFKEKPESMMSSIANYFFVTGKLLDLDEARDLYLNVTIDEVKAAAEKVLEGKPVISLVGPVPDADYESIVLKSIE